LFSIDIKEATILATSIELVVTALAAVEAVEVVGAVEVITADGVAAAVLVVLVVPETAMLFTDLSYFAPANLLRRAFNKAHA
jgi:hypothetical protein